jgi:hypothetical protein
MGKDKGNMGTLIALIAVSVLCALLIGYIVGTIGRDEGKAKPAAGADKEVRPEGPKTGPEPDEARLDGPRVDLVYDEPDGDAVWNDTYPEIARGDGAIKGKVLSNDLPAAGLSVALILAPGRKTVTVPVGADGGFTIPIAKGEYNFNALAVYQGADRLDEQLLLNGLNEAEGGQAGSDPAAVSARFDELSKQYGPQEAARRLAAEEKAGGGEAAGEQFPFTVGDQPYEFPPFQYRDLVETVSPAEDSEAALAGLKFIWSPYPSAASYALAISEFLGDGDSTSLSPVLSREGIKENFIDYQALLAAPKPKAKDDDEAAPAGRLEPGKRYAYTVFAFDDKGKLLSASGDPRAEEVIEFRVK